MKKLLPVIFLLFSQLIIAQNDFLLAENYYRQNEYEKAIQLYKKLYKKSPYNTTYLKRLIACYQETDNFLTAENLLKNRLEKNKKASYLNVYLGYNFERQYKKEIAKEYYNKAISSIEKNAGFGGVIGSTFKNYNLLDEAVRAYEKTMEVNPKSNYLFQIAQIYGEKGDFEKMFQSYIDMVDKKESYLKNVSQRYAAKYITDDSENENNILFKKTLLKKSASNPKAVWNRLLSWLFIQQKDFNKAFIQEKGLYARNADELSSIVDLGKIAFNNKDYETAEKCFDFVLAKTNYPAEKVSAQFYKIQIAVATKQSNIEEQFQTIFNEYGKNSNTFPLQIAYADYLTFEKNEPEKAKQILEEAMPFAKSKFQKARLKIKLGEVLVFTGKFNKALIYYSQVQTRLKNHPLAQEARFKVAQTSYFKNDFKWAMAQLKVLKGSATQLIANDATDLFLTISDNEPKDSIATGLTKYAKADLLAFQHKNEEAIAVLNSILKDFNGQSIEDEALFKQAKLFNKEEQYESTITNLEKIITMDAEGILVDDSLYELAELYNTKLNQPEKAQEYYQKIIFEHPSSIYVVDARKKFRKLRGDNIN